MLLLLLSSGWPRRAGRRRGVLQRCGWAASGQHLWWSPRQGWAWWGGGRRPWRGWNRGLGWRGGCSCRCGGGGARGRALENEGRGVVLVGRRPVPSCPPTCARRPTRCLGLLGWGGWGKGGRDCSRLLVPSRGGGGGRQLRFLFGLGGRQLGQDALLVAQDRRPPALPPCVPVHLLALAARPPPLFAATAAAAAGCRGATSSVAAVLGGSAACGRAAGSCRAAGGTRGPGRGILRRAGTGAARPAPVPRLASSSSSSSFRGLALASAGGTGGCHDGCAGLYVFRGWMGAYGSEMGRWGAWRTTWTDGQRPRGLLFTASMPERPKKDMPRTSTHAGLADEAPRRVTRRSHATQMTAPQCGLGLAVLPLQCCCMPRVGALFTPGGPRKTAPRS